MFYFLYRNCQKFRNKKDVLDNSEFDETYSEEHLENMIREKMLIMTNEICKWQKYDGF